MLINKNTFITHIKANQPVYDEFVRLAHQKFNACPYYSARAIFYELRMQYGMQHQGTPYKICQNWATFYARKLAHDEPRFLNFFKFKNSKNSVFANDFDANGDLDLSWVQVYGCDKATIGF